MIPLRDAVRSESHPIVNSVLIAINVVVFLVELAQGADLGRFTYTFGLVPARYTVPEVSVHFSPFQQVFSFVTFMFLHGGWFHLIGNMWFLYIFGDNVEDHLGHAKYLFFYFLCGLASGISHLLLNLNSAIPTIGASGAIAGVMGGYFLLHPHAKILTLIPIFVFFHFVNLPAYLFLGIWLVFQFVSAAGSSGQAGGVAWWAHIGGFIFGAVFLKLFQLLPTSPKAGKMRNLTLKKSTPRLQVVRPVELGAAPDVHGVISVTEKEARLGARKLINIAEGFKKRTFFVTVPPGVSAGSKLRLKGMGRRMPNGVLGDLYLKVEVKD